ncbi:hypothetical protein TD95_004407 [Thielaviopsis punctulata]|uniref:5'-deoxynucleotidase n=1 Tax=Thielaviopsis punctulata TaxID=72032 RepID=A0A0F4ZLR6_9PEZI|nr:hypothetical protein TD95_004407 [Thielaviopsis punctulata]
MRTLFNAFVRTHHITSRKKVNRIRHAAEANDVSFVLLRSGGAPGLMYVESETQQSVTAWVDFVHGLRYKDFRCVRKPAEAQIETDSDPSDITIPKVLQDWTVDKALSIGPVPKPKDERSQSSPIEYFHLLERLKIVKREGWKRHGILRGESIADHMYRMSMMAMCPPPSLISQGLDLNKCIKMCLIHDIAEAVVGDITPADLVSKVEKKRRETVTVDYISDRLLRGATGEELKSIWHEHEDGVTLESCFVQDLDKLEMLLQMAEYESRSNGQINLEDFTYVTTKIQLPEMKQWAEEILQDRPEFWKDKQKPKNANNITVEMQDKYYARN